MDFFNFLNMIGGLALFLYGMETLGEGLSKMAGGKLETILEKLTSKRIFAVLLGAFVTAVIQSSSATTVMVVGFVNSGLMQLSQAVGIIMGANIGTTVTSWILSLSGIEGNSIFINMLKPSSFSPIVAAIGIILVMSSAKESKKKDAGSIMLGFAVLMFGMETMSGSVAGLADNASFTSIMTKFSNPVLGMAIGAILTAVIQSSSASVGILQALCMSGAVPYAVALPIIMGQNIGTCVTSIISSIGANKNAKRAAMIHLYFNLIGTIIFMCVFYLLNCFIHFAFLSESANVAGIAVIHSLFNIGASIVLFPFADKLVALAKLTIPEGHKKSDIPMDAVELALDERFLERPAFAVELCKEKVKDMAALTNESIQLALDLLKDYDVNKAGEVSDLEKMVDKYEDVLGSYLIKLSSKSISQSDSQSLSVILHSISDFERISDLALNVSVAAEKINDKSVNFSENAGNELEVLCRAVRDICNMTTLCFSNMDLNEATHIEPLEVTIDGLTKKIKENHIRRLQKGKCTAEVGIVLEDLLIQLERVSDHCSNIAVEMLTIFENEYNTHEYFRTFSEKEQKVFNDECEKMIKKYAFTRK